MRRIEAALRESSNEDGAYPDLEKGWSSGLEEVKKSTLEGTYGAEVSTEECLAPIRDLGHQLV